MTLRGHHMTGKARSIDRRHADTYCDRGARVPRAAAPARPATPCSLRPSVSPMMVSLPFSPWIMEFDHADCRVDGRLEHLAAYFRMMAADKNCKQLRNDAALQRWISI